MILQDDTTVREEARKAFASRTNMRERLDHMERQLAERTDYDSAEYTALVERFTQEHDRYQNQETQRQLILKQFWYLIHNGIALFLTNTHQHQHKQLVL